MTNLNAQASQLAIDTEYFNNKAIECWEILQRIDDFVTGDHIDLMVNTSKDHCSHFQVNSIDITVINRIFMTLCSYYRDKHVAAKIQLTELQAASVVTI